MSKNRLEATCQEMVMDQQLYEGYLKAFHARDYGSVLAHFHERISVRFAGLELTTQSAVRDLYLYFHSHVDERIEIIDFMSSRNRIYLEARVVLSCFKTMDSEQVATTYPGLLALKGGQSVNLGQLIQYRIEEGLFRSVNCAAFPDPVVVL
jgi:hypothetical protein